MKIKKNLGDVTPHFDRAEMNMTNITLLIKFDSFFPFPLHFKILLLQKGKEKMIEFD